MISHIISKFFGDRHTREAKKMQPLIDEINSYYNGDEPLFDFEDFEGEFKDIAGKKLSELSDEQLKDITQRFKKIVSSAMESIETVDKDKEEIEKERYEIMQSALDAILPHGYAMVKEVCRRLKQRAESGEYRKPDCKNKCEAKCEEYWKCKGRWNVCGHEIVWDMIPYDVQLIGGIALHRGMIAEMATGEGKTLVATLPLYLNALTGLGVHLVTVNDYLARRDSEWMGKIFEFLGLTVGCIQNDMDSPQRQKAYSSDITYGTNNEFGFDYLRDNMVIDASSRVQRKHYYAIVDEVDSVLIDEARTPLIISGAVEHSTHRYDELKPKVADLVWRQETLVNKMVQEAKKLLAESESQNGGKEDKIYEAGFKLLTAQYGLPKNKALMKLYQDPEIKKLVNKIEMDLIRDKRQHEAYEGLYFHIDERNNTVDLSEKGREILSPKDDPDFFKLDDFSEIMQAIDSDPSLSDEEKAIKKEEASKKYALKTEKLHNITQLLKGYALFEKDVDYVVQDGKVLIVDEFTGRILPGRRYSDGLHQALEAKEGVSIEKETQTLATITLQNYFRMYKKLAGMTGTAETESEEFYKIYKLDVLVIPTNDYVRRVDYDDVMYQTIKDKYKALINEIKEMHEAGRPVLVGTVSVEVSEKLSRLLQREGIPHNVLNAKYHQKEAEIVKDAGLAGAVTIATNMAGRGTDIKLGPGVVNEECKQIRDKFSKEKQHAKDVPWCCIKCSLENECKKGNKPLCGKSEQMFDCKGDVPCGLHIIGTERHEARRIDRQLRGRSGRQGDPGSSKFFLSLEDDLMRLFGSERITGIMSKLGLKEGDVIEHPFITSAISNAQKKVESNNFSIRKHLLEYDDVMNQQREIIYEKRLSALEGDPKELREEIHEMMREFIESQVEKLIDPHIPASEWNWKEFQQSIQRTIPSIGFSTSEFSNQKIEKDDLVEFLFEKAKEAYKRKLLYVGEEDMQQIERMSMLMVIDDKWKEHLYFMDHLKDSIGFRGYAQQDPLVEYKKEGYIAFSEMIDNINADVISLIFRAEIRAYQEERKQAIRRKEREMQSMQTFHQESTGMGVKAGAKQKSTEEAEEVGEEQEEEIEKVKLKPIQRTQPKVGRNDPCPCGSGKKYKKCCGKNV